MLSAEEFTVGYVADAKPLSLMLPRTRYEHTILVGHVEGKPTAVVLTGQHASLCFECERNNSFGGLIIPGVRIEVDETSLCDPAGMDTPSCSIIRRDTRLAIQAQSERRFGGSTSVTLHDELVSAGEQKAGFTKWQVVIGEGVTKRVLWKVDVSPSGD